MRPGSGVRCVTIEPAPRWMPSARPMPGRSPPDARSVPAHGPGDGAVSTVTRALVIGGTGPTGIPLVRNLVDRGHDVTIVHRGLHERPETPRDVPHVHTDPY